MNTKPPTLDEKVRFTYDLYRTSKIDVSHPETHTRDLARMAPRETHETWLENGASFALLAAIDLPSSVEMADRAGPSRCM